MNKNLKFYAVGLIISFLLSVIFVGLFDFLFGFYMVGFSMVGFSILIALIILYLKYK